MSTAEDTLVELVDVNVDDELPHHACCREDRFLCGAPFHPEMEEDGPDGPHCAECDEIIDAMVCSAGRGGEHEHCPFTGKICP